MFEGRFHTPGDATFGANWQFWQGRGGLDPASVPAVDGVVGAFAERQVGRRERITGKDSWPGLERTLRQVCEVRALYLSAPL